jgi:GTP-binding protein HflX
LASALTGAGLAELLEAIDRHLSQSGGTVTLSVALADGAAIAWLYERGRVIARRDDEAFAHLRVALAADDLARFRRRQAQPLGDER